MNLLTKLMSRKLLLAIAAIIVALTEKQLTTAQMAIVAGVAATYIVAEALVDKAGVQVLDRAVHDGLKLGAQAADELDDDGFEDDPPPAPKDPATSGGAAS
jgi:hypothetical protein